MKKCLIIGAGQLGSRHLQGIVKYSQQLEIYVLDTSTDSLKVAEEREKEIIHNHNVIYTQSWANLPDYFDLVIIATSANVREMIIDELLKRHKVNFLILEKVLFQDLDAYDRVSKLLNKYAVTTFVNHPRRMFKSYAKLKESIQLDSKSTYSVHGGNWGLGCNGLHFLDLFVYLSGKRLKDVNVESIDDDVSESSRKGFVEFTGTLTGRLENGSFFSITSSKGESSSITATIFNNEQRFIIQEGGVSQVYELAKKNLFKLESGEFNVLFISEATTNILEDLFANNSCLLPSFEEARHTHELFIKAMLEKYNKITGLQTKVLSIT